MPLTIEIGCDGTFHVTSDNDTRDFGSVTVRAKDLKAVHLAVDHHYRDYKTKEDNKHHKDAVKGCPFCERRT